MKSEGLKRSGALFYLFIAVAVRAHVCSAVPLELSYGGGPSGTCSQSLGLDGITFRAAR